jgi:hypothetical protein
MVAAVQAARDAPPLRPAAALRAAALATRDVLSRRPQRAIRDLFGDARGTTVSDSFRAWLATTPSSDGAVEAPPMPLLLSRRDESA